MSRAPDRSESKAKSIDPGLAEGEPTDGPEAQKRREKMQHQDKAEGEDVPQDGRS